MCLIERRAVGAVNGNGNGNGGEGEFSEKWLRLETLEGRQQREEGSVAAAESAGTTPEIEELIVEELVKRHQEWISREKAT